MLGCGFALTCATTHRAGAVSPVNGTSAYWTTPATSSCSAVKSAWCAAAGDCTPGCRCITSVAFVAPRAVAAVSVVILAIPMIVMLAISCSGSVGCLRSFGKFGGLPSDSLVERRVHALYNTAALSIYAGCLGLIASGAFISSTLSIASGAIAIATLRGATVAGDIISGRTVSVTHPTHSFQLAVGACEMRAVSIL